MFKTIDLTMDSPARHCVAIMSLASEAVNRISSCPTLASADGLFNSVDEETVLPSGNDGTDIQHRQRFMVVEGSKSRTDYRTWRSAGLRYGSWGNRPSSGPGRRLDL
jgi:hypothetical protein